MPGKGSRPGIAGAARTCAQPVQHARDALRRAPAHGSAPLKLARGDQNFALFSPLNHDATPRARLGVRAPAAHLRPERAPRIGFGPAETPARSANASSPIFKHARELRIDVAHVKRSQKSAPAWRGSCPAAAASAGAAAVHVRHRSSRLRRTRPHATTRGHKARGASPARQECLAATRVGRAARAGQAADRGALGCARLASKGAVCDRQCLS